MVNWLKYVFMALTSSVGDLKPLSWNQELQLKCWQFFFFTLYFLFSSKWMNTWLRLGPWMVDPSEALHSRLRLHQGHAGGLVVVRVDGWHHLAADWVEDGQGGERPGDLTVLGHAPQLLCGLLDGTVMNQLDAEGWRRLVFVCFFFSFPHLPQSFTSSIIWGDLHSDCACKTNLTCNLICPRVFFHLSGLRSFFLLLFYS